ncbi:ligase-associated DNA damage response endonuclease PdeM [Stenotrophomonas sp.]|uniref:ligase-associated DNA damage response endonuclease PdeM n=1 Tax=Stenotrophomonas sp. TaxID=69392 RepID=UPI0028AC1652|nr:ligase-associated DNA damage response endonuclease PdeM [Stenotrophomonas sp.]
MAERLEIALAGEPVVLLADRALYWPARRRLIVADLHLGKGEVLRRAGIPVPSGGTRADLQRLARLLAMTSATSLWILGDFLHGARSRTSDQAWEGFRAAHRLVAMAVVPGNHDRALDADAAGLERIADGEREGPFVFRHAPAAVVSGPPDHQICGHLHPVLKLPGMVATPLFWIREGSTVLPAFSLFTGGFRLDLQRARGSVACDGVELLKLG